MWCPWLDVVRADGVDDPGGGPFDGLPDPWELEVDAEPEPGELVEPLGQVQLGAAAVAGDDGGDAIEQEVVGAGIALDAAGIAQLIVTLGDRGIRVMGIEGVDADELGSALPPLLKGGRPTSGGDTVVACDHANAAPAPGRPEPSSLLVEDPIRSGQSVIFPYGDVTVLGAVSSGAEVVAGGSIHVYGALRGRAMAGSMGNARARIFCTRNEAELISIDGYYRTAEEMNASCAAGRCSAGLKTASSR